MGGDCRLECDGRGVYVCGAGMLECLGGVHSFFSVQLICNRGSLDDKMILSCVIPNVSTVVPPYCKAAFSA
jgi:hypothetical protein